MTDDSRIAAEWRASAPPPPEPYEAPVSLSPHRPLLCVLTCKACGQRFQSWNKHRHYCCRTCKEAVRALRNKRARNAPLGWEVKPAPVRDVRGRSCRWCKLEDHETAWSRTSNECAACNRARHRGQCKCGAPRTAAGACAVPCEPPSWLEPVILLDAGGERERVVYRAKHGDWIEVAGRAFKVSEGEPLVVTLPTDIWLKVKR